MKKLGHSESLSLYLPIEPHCMQFTLPRSREDLYAHSINENRREKNKKNKSLAHMYTHTGQQNEFL